jgi:hypothetical protein
MLDICKNTGEISSLGKDKLMRPREIARSNDGNANSIGAEKKLATAKPKPWESEPYNYEELKNAGSSSLSNPRQDYIERVHGPHQDDGFTPSDENYGYGSSGLGVTPDLYASASDLGTLAGGRWSDRVFWNANKEEGKRLLAERTERQAAKTLLQLQQQTRQAEAAEETLRRFQATETLRQLRLK